MLEHVDYACTRETFLPALPFPARWLDREGDSALLRAYWKDDTILPEFLTEARNAGYTYTAIIETGEIIALAAVWRYSEESWELAAVSVDVDHRQRGYGGAICSFVTAYILDADKLATCNTRVDNTPMRQTAESIGFYEVSESLRR
ncbi:MAG: GNAT family N-acetyltransferase [Anaerolineae bacterium]